MIYLGGATLFCIFITDKRQEWDKPSNEETIPITLSTVELNQEDSIEKQDEKEKNDDNQS
jgi:hypothetical protein